jgi:hypothetical protein
MGPRATFLSPTGRSQPSREMVLCLAEAFRCRLRAQCVAGAAGFAAVFRESALGAPELLRSSGCSPSCSALRALPPISSIARRVCCANRAGVATFAPFVSEALQVMTVHNLIRLTRFRRAAPPDRQPKKWRRCCWRGRALGRREHRHRARRAARRVGAPGAARRRALTWRPPPVLAVHSWATASAPLLHDAHDARRAAGCDAQADIGPSCGGRRIEMHLRGTS